MKTKMTLATLAIALAGCGPDQPPQPAYQPPLQQAQPQYAPAAPVVVQQAPQHSGMQDMLVGGAIGALATHALASRNAPAAPAPQVTNTHLIERTVIVRQAPPRVLPAPPVAPRPAFTTPVAPRPAAVPYTAPRTSYAPPNRVVPAYKVSTVKRK